MQYENVTCPHCGLLCDDISVQVTGLTLQLDPNHPCKKAFEDASIDSNNRPTALVHGKKVSEEEALDHATKLLREAKLPLTSGLIADVQTCREAVALTEKLGGVIDHANGQSIRKSVAVMQRLGEVRTTLAEVRNRADCIVIFGAKLRTRFPRLMEKILCPEKTLGNENSRNKKIIILDISTSSTSRKEVVENVIHFFLNFPLLASLIYRFQEVVSRPKEYFSDCDEQTQLLFDVLDTIDNSQYTTLVWDTSEFEPESAEHTIQALTESVKTLMRNIRCVALPLGGSKGEVTANQVATWQTGVPLPVSFTHDIPVHNPTLFDGWTMLQNNETDCLLWISTFNSNDLPPACDIPTIILGHPNMKHVQADVYIPVGVPGIDHRGLACRTDNVATLPLQAIRNSNLPPASILLNKLLRLV